MSLIDRIERRTRWFAVPNIALPIAALQALVWILQLSKPQLIERLFLQRSLVMGGEWWRLVTFLFVPVQSNPLFLFFALYIFCLMSSGLENLWGAWRYNLYLLIGWLATIGAVFIAPDGIVSNQFLYTSVFLAFAELFPTFQLMLFFIIPVQVRYIALVTWIFWIIQFGDGDALTRLVIAAAACSFFVFFTRDLIQKIRGGRRRMVKRIEKQAIKDNAINTCIVCGATEKSHPQYEFRYCPKCAGTPCYCMTHMEGHVHRTSINPPV